MDGKIDKKNFWGNLNLDKEFKNKKPLSVLRSKFKFSIINTYSFHNDSLEKCASKVKIN